MGGRGAASPGLTYNHFFGINSGIISTKLSAQNHPDIVTRRINGSRGAGVSGKKWASAPQVRILSFFFAQNISKNQAHFRQISFNLFA